MKYGWVAAALAVFLLFVVQLVSIREIETLQEEKADLLAENSHLQYEASEALTRITIQECEDRVKEILLREKIQRFNPGLPKHKLIRMAQAFEKYSREYDLDADLMLAVATEESRFNSHAISPVGAIGVMQVMPFWTAELEFLNTPDDLLDVEKNIHAGAFILRQYLDMFQGNRRMALLAYNRGPGTVLRHLRAGTDPDNGYPGMVLASYNVIKRE